MQTFLVGGAVRDHLLGLESKDNDYVVVGSSPEELLSLGFKQVGSNFPVFLHPDSGEEYALARREKKTGPGYGGFSVEFGSDVTLEEDLSRRDLTINAMAMMEDGTIVDPYGGQEDLNNGVLRHVSNAFAEDPLRVLRVARFVARYGFTVHNDTLLLSCKLVDEGELKHLTTERVWKEFSRMLEEPFFEDGLTFLIDCGALTGNELLNTLLGYTFVASDGLAFVMARLKPDHRILTVTEKAYFYTNISFEDMHFVSNDLKSAVKRLMTMCDFTTGSMTTEFVAQDYVKFIDQNRAQLSGDVFRDELRKFAELFEDEDYVRSFFEKFFKAADAVYALDFTTLLKDVPKSDIKSVVHAHKVAAVKKEFAA